MTTEFDAAGTARMKTSILNFKENKFREETKDTVEEQEAKFTNIQSETTQTIALNSDIKNLAAVIGLSYENTDTPEEIIAALADELEAQIDESENNPQALSMLMGYYNKLNSLDAQLDKIKHGETKLFSTMDMIAQKNREEFGF